MSFKRGWHAAAISRRMRASEGGFMWYRYTGTRGGISDSASTTNEGVKCREARATSSWESEKESSRKMALRCRVLAAAAQRRSVGSVSPEKRTERPGRETTYP